MGVKWNNLGETKWSMSSDDYTTGDGERKKSMEILSTLFVKSTKTKWSPDKKEKSIYKVDKLDQIIVMIQNVQQKIEKNIARKKRWKK